VLFLVQQKMFMPPATDEQTRLTQRMMTIMTLVMGLFFFRVPAGLCVYFITSSLWGIAERILVKKTLPPKKELGDVVLEGGPAKTEKSSSLAQRLKDRIQPPEPTFDAPNKRKRPGRNK
jgi:YidC/Oxa1 family membrane protein insertase